MFMRTMSAFTVAFALTATTLPAAAQQSSTFTYLSLIHI